MNMEKKTIPGNNESSKIGLDYVEYIDALEIVHLYEFRYQEEWMDLVTGFKPWIKLPPYIPKEPSKVYQGKGWTSWDEWLNGSEYWLTFEKAKSIVQECKIEYQQQWYDMFESLRAKNPSFLKIPRNPDKIYLKHGWISWENWLLRTPVPTSYSPFLLARGYARSLRLTEVKQWIESVDRLGHYRYYKSVVVPKYPYYQYKSDGWVDWDDWLGKNIYYPDFYKTRKYVHSLKLRSKDSWFDYYINRFNRDFEELKDMYMFPSIAYKNHGWISWDDWLGIKL